MVRCPWTDGGTLVHSLTRRTQVTVQQSGYLTAAGGTMTRDNAAVVRRVVERIWNRGDLPLADHLFSTTYVNHGGLIPDIVRGPEAIKVSVALYRIAFPGLSITIDRLEADADMVECGWTAYTVVRTLVMGTYHDSSRRALIGTTSSRLVHGQIAETWMTWDPESRLCRFARTVSRAQDS